MRQNATRNVSVLNKFPEGDIEHLYRRRKLPRGY